MTKPITRDQLSEFVARRMLDDMEEHGSIEDFCEKLLSHPEMYLLEIAYGAVDCIGLSGCLHPRVTNPRGFGPDKEN